MFLKIIFVEYLVIGTQLCQQIYSLLFNFEVIKLLKMTFDVKIYGEIVPFQEKWITDQGGYVNQTEVQNQLKEADGKDIRVRIKSFGGDVEEGFAIYSELRRYAKENNAKVTTLAEGQCASIATVIFLAGDERLVTEFTQPFVHNAWCYAMGDAQTLSKTAVDLEVVNDQYVKLKEAPYPHKILYIQQDFLLGSFFQDHLLQ